MRSEVIVKIKTKFINELKSGYPLILKDAIHNVNDVSEEGTIIKLLDEKNQFLGKGYYGKQNKGYGWILTRKSRNKSTKLSLREKSNQHYINERAFTSLMIQRHSAS